MNDEKVQSLTVPGETASQPVPKQEPHSVSMSPGNGTQTAGKKNGHKSFARTLLADRSRRGISGQGRRPDRDGDGSSRHGSA